MLSTQPNTLYSFDRSRPGRDQRHIILKTGPLEHVDPAVLTECMGYSDEGFPRFRGSLGDTERQGKVAFAHTQAHAMVTPGFISEWVYGASEG